MKTNIVETSGSCRLEIRQLERESFTDYFITATVERPLSVVAAADELFSQVAAVLVLRRIQPFQEKVYGRTGVRSAVLKRRDTIYRQRGLDRTMPVTWIQGSPLQGCDFVGVQIWGTSPRDGEVCVRTVEIGHGARAPLDGSGFRLLHLPSISGQPGAGRVAQATQMFTNMGLGLKAHGMRFANILRTWIYVARLLDWYGELERCPHRDLPQGGAGLEGGPVFPASAGIWARAGMRSASWTSWRSTPTAGRRQGHSDRRSAGRPPPSTTAPRSRGEWRSRSRAGARSSFRAPRASTPRARAPTSATRRAQSLETLMCIAAILEEPGGGLRHIASATLFCKNRGPRRHGSG